MSTTNVFITGANRGVGYAFVQAYLARPNHIVIGSVRDIAAARSNGLENLPAAPGSELVLVKIESASFTDPAKAVAELESRGISKLDIVIANAGIAGEVAPAAEGDAEDFAKTLAVNAVAPMVLFAATKPLLDRAANPKWVPISSAVASLGNHNTMFTNMGGHPMGYGYGASKAALNHLSLNIHSENPRLTVVVVAPG
ncbi:Norsolorinic acid ketoreductase 4 [Colletotrichum chlorophyti]|uniref:Norsolorinic acid ketoreductase 4 n=1 Tax=Colletotrichum chlorophyti TaxID=708187 RepID=A0A1Q8RWV8_9PEZI|nr:Norsolorinic acid ketoreductase 4 [Colletotrichum chlorophyti]